MHNKSSERSDSQGSLKLRRTTSHRRQSQTRRRSSRRVSMSKKKKKFWETPGWLNKVTDSVGGIAKKTASVTASVAKKTAEGVVGGTTTLFKQVGNLIDEEISEV